MAQGICTIEENGEVCGRPVVGWGWCGKHYARWKKYGDPAHPVKKWYRGVGPEVRFRDKVNTNGPILRPELGPCHEWIAGRNRFGYGLFNVGGKNWLAHRWAWEQAHGPIPDGLELDHLCRNRGCVKSDADANGPAHIEPITHAENIRRGDGGQHNARKTHCKHDHEFTPENTFIDKRGMRQCRTCARQRTREYARKRRQAGR